MRPCPTCDYLLEHDVHTCRFCGTNLRAADAAAAEAAAAPPVAVAAPTASPLTTSVIAAIAMGVVIVAVVAWFTLARGNEQPAGASARTAHHAAATTSTAASPSTTALVIAPAPTAASGFTVVGVPHASANIELPSGSSFSAADAGGFVRVSLGNGVDLRLGSAADLGLGTTAPGLLAELRAEAGTDLGGTFAGLHIVANAGGPAVAFTYRLTDGSHGQGTVVLINRTPIVVQLVVSPGTTANALQLSIYGHAVASITPVL